MATHSWTLSRRSVLLGFAAGGALIASRTVPGFAQGNAKLSFITAFDVLLEQMHELNAVAGGHLSAQGIELDIIPGRGTSLAIQQIVAEQSEISRVGALDLIKGAAAQDVPLKSIAVSLHQGIFNVVSSASNPVKSPSEMRGKTIGVASIGGGTENMLNLMLTNAGIPIAEVQRQAVGSSPGNVEQVKQGRLDAFFVTVEGAMALTRANEAVHIWSANNYAPMPGGAFITRTEFAEKNQDLMVKLLKGFYASAEELLVADPNMILDRIEKTFEVAADKDRDFRVQALATYNYMALAEGRDNLLRNVPEVWHSAVKQISDAGIATLADPDSIYTNDYIDEAIKSSKA